MRIVKPSAELEWCTPDALKVIERAARTCYLSADKISRDESSAEKLIRFVIERGHLSVLEHAVASFRFVVDRGISHEIVRHRIASFSQESTRYCAYAKGKHGSQIAVIKPTKLTKEQAIVWEESCRIAEKAYLHLSRLGCRPEIARSILPTCLKTELVLTANFREWLHIFDLRTSKQAHPQVVAVMLQAQAVLQQKYPVIFGAVK